MKVPDTALVELEEARFEVGNRSLWRHVKSGREYRIFGHAIIKATLETAILYAPEGQGWDVIWSRPAAEFLDGRFEKIAEA